MELHELLWELQNYDFSQHSVYNGFQPEGFGKIFDAIIIHVENILDGTVTGNARIDAENMINQGYNYMKTVYEGIDFENLEILAKNTDGMYYALPIFDTNKLLPKLGEQLTNFVKNPTPQGLSDLEDTRLELVNADGEPSYVDRVEELWNRINYINTI